jgi:post-segregation antitoxin (ccd killing protein)
MTKETSERSLNKVKRKRERTRLNIAIDKGILEDAKVFGINISAAIEESLVNLIALATKQSQVERKRDYLSRKYEETFKEIRQLLRGFEIEEVEIGEIRDTDLLRSNIEAYTEEGLDMKEVPEWIGTKIILRKDMILWLKNGKYYVFKHNIYDNITSLHQPNVIYTNLLTQVTAKLDDDEEKLRKIKLGLKIVKTVLTNGEDSSESGLETPSFRRILESSGVVIG